MSWPKRSEAESHSSFLGSYGLRRFWRIKSGICQTRLAVRKTIRSIPIDIHDAVPGVPRLCRTLGIAPKSEFGKEGVPQRLYKYPGKRQIPAEKKTKPVIFASVCQSKEIPGGNKFNGGLKMLNQLVKLARRHGYEAYLVTWDGTYEPWLMDHQPHISLDEFRERLAGEADVRCVTSWCLSESFIQAAESIYFWDMSLAHTSTDHFPMLFDLYRKNIVRSAGCNRMIAAWHMANWKMPCTVLPDWIDEENWFPHPEKRIPGRIGYMIESEKRVGYEIDDLKTEKKIRTIDGIVRATGLDLEFCPIEGDERDVLEQMRSCEVFLGMNPGKDKMWGEGFELQMMEAMWAGCAVISYDVIGNREYMLHGFNGFMVPRERPEEMARALVDLYGKPGQLEGMRENSLSLLRTCHT